MLTRLFPALRDDATRARWSRRFLIAVALLDATANLAGGGGLLLLGAAALTGSILTFGPVSGALLLGLGTVVTAAGLLNGALVIGQLRRRAWAYRLGVVLTLYGLLLSFGAIGSPLGIGSALLHLAAYQVWRSPAIVAMYLTAPVGRGDDNPGR